MVSISLQKYTGAHKPHHGDQYLVFVKHEEAVLDSYVSLAKFLSSFQVFFFLHDEE